MKDKSVPSAKVIMIKYDTENYPRYSFPEGFYITGYKPGYEYEWAAVELEEEDLAPLERGVEVFKKTFMSEPDMLYDRCLFVIDGRRDRVAAVLSLWRGSLGSDAPRCRIHWVATRAEYQGLGLIKAALTYVFDLYHRLSETGYIYLTTQTESYKAINIYKKFGFLPYMGELHTDGFDKENAAWAWSIIDGKINEYKNRNK